jgi:predicted nucleotidyltransferase
MRLDDPLDDIFASASHVRLLRALYALPSNMGRSGRDLARRASVSHPRANQVLAELADQGLVTVERLPGTDLYRLNQQHVLADPLGKLFDLEPNLKFELLSLLARELKARRLPVKQARIFGSAARGAMAPASDVDLALITSRQNIGAVEAAAQEIAETVRERFGTRLNVLVGSPLRERSGRSPQSKGAVWDAIEREGIDVLATSKAVS